MNRKRSNVGRKLILNRTQRFNFEKKKQNFYQSQSNVSSANKFSKTTNFFLFANIKNQNFRKLNFEILYLKDLFTAQEDLAS